MLYSAAAAAARPLGLSVCRSLTQLHGLLSSFAHLTSCSAHSPALSLTSITVLVSAPPGFPHEQELFFLHSVFSPSTTILFFSPQKKKEKKKHPWTVFFVWVGRTLLQRCSSLALTSFLCVSHLSPQLLGSASLICSLPFFPLYFIFFSSAAGLFFSLLLFLVHPQNIFRLSGSDTCWYTGWSHTAQVLCQHPKGDRSCICVSRWVVLCCEAVTEDMWEFSTDDDILTLHFFRLKVGSDLKFTSPACCHKASLL